MGIGIVKLYKKFHQAAMIGKASNRNQKIPSFLLKNQNFHEKFEILKKKGKRAPWHWRSEAVQKISPSCDDWRSLK